MTATAPDIEATQQASAFYAEPRRLGLGRWLFQPLACVAAVVGSLAYVNVANISESEQRALGYRTC
jgi:osmoprotectant transport system permease protein